MQRRGILDYPMHLNAPVDPNDRFAYGWRYVVESLPDGSERTVQIPLTLDDILHPQEEDFHVLSDPHTEDCTYLRVVLKSQLAKTPGAVVLNDCRIAWDAAGEFGHGPDAAVIFNVKEVKRWGTFNAVEEGTRPSLIIEVTSPSTRSTDLVNKVWEYAEVQVPHYVIADVREKPSGRQIKFIDYHLGEDNEYETRPLGPDGRVWLDEDQLLLGAENGQIVCCDKDGKRKQSYAEEVQGRQDAEKRAETEKQAREELEARVRFLEMKLHDSGRSTNGTTKPE